MKCPFCSNELTLTYRDEFGHRYRFYEVACSTCKWKTYSRSKNEKWAWASAQEFCVTKTPNGRRGFFNLNGTISHWSFEMKG